MVLTLLVASILPAARAALIQQSNTVADGLNSAHAALTDQWGQNRQQLSVYANEVNAAAQSMLDFVTSFGGTTVIVGATILVFVVEMIRRPSERVRPQWPAAIWVASVSSGSIPCASWWRTRSRGAA